MKKVCVFAAHPDDEVLGCGGTIARHVKSGDQVSVVIFAEGITSRDSKRDTEKRHEELYSLHQAVHAANKVLGVSSVQIHSFPDNRMDSVELIEVVKLVESTVNEHQPEIIYTHHIGDLNIDHQIVHRAVITACRPQGNLNVESLLCFEVPSSTEWQIPNSSLSFTPNWWVNITDHLSTKLKALRCYETEMRTWPHPRSYQGVEHLAKWRGCSVGMDCAEAFILNRNIID